MGTGTEGAGAAAAAADGEGIWAGGWPEAAASSGSDSDKLSASCAGLGPLGGLLLPPAGWLDQLAALPPGRSTERATVG